MIMKTKYLLHTVCAAALLLCVSGCKDSTETVEPTMPENSQGTTGTGSLESDARQLANETQGAVAGAGTSVSNAAQDAGTELRQAAGAAEGEAQSVLAQAREYVAEKKYTEALNSLKRLSNLKLTPEQQKTLDELRNQIQASLAQSGVSNAASKLGNMLGGQK